MGTQTGAAAVASEIRKGNQCLLSFGNEHYMVRILDVGPDTMTLSFPGEDYPIEGLTVELEFHDDDGIDCYATEVLEGPRGSDSGIVVRRPTTMVRNQHRKNWRITTDLTVQIKEQVHIRRYDASVVNLSQGGALLLTTAPFDLDSTVELTLSLPGHAAATVLGTVVHVGSAQAGPRGTHRYIGVRFVGLEPQVARSITDFIWRQMAGTQPFQ